MKIYHSSLLCALAVSVLSLLSCVREESRDAVRLQFEATFECDSIADVPQVWSSDDRIAVSGANASFNTSRSSGKPEATFKGKAVPADEYYAVLPFDAFGHFAPSSPSIASVTLPCVQTASRNSIPHEARLAVSHATSSEEHFIFRSPFAYLKFTVGPRTGNIRSVSVMSLDGTRLSGSFSVDCASDDPYPYPDPESFSNVMLVPSSGVLAEGDYYIAILPGAEGGYEMAFEDAEGRIALVQTSYDSCTERGEVMDIGSLQRLEFKNWDIRPVSGTALAFSPGRVEAYLQFYSDCPVEARVSRGDDWLSIVRTKAVDRNSLQVVAQANEGDKRLGQIIVESLDGRSSLVYNIQQSGNQAPDVEKQRKILTDLYEATGGDGWKRKDNWCTDAPLNDWYGVTADEKGNISYIYLLDNGLKGCLPDNIGEFCGNNIYLDFRDNEIVGALPASVFKLFHVNLSGNKLDSIIPPEDPDQCPIYSVSLYDNNLEGSLPEFFGHLPFLQQLDLSRNRFTGEVPESYAMPLRGTLYLYDNLLTGRLPQSFIEADNFNYLWPAILRQKGDGFDLDGVRIPLQNFNLKEKPLTSDDIYASNEYTAILTNYGSVVDHELLHGLTRWYQAYHESGFEVIYIGYAEALDNYSAYPWYIADSAPPLWSYVSQFATTTLTLVDNEGYIVVNPFLDDPDKVLETLEARFGDIENMKPSYPAGSVNEIQKATSGNGIDLVILGDAFTADMIEDGVFDDAVRTAVDAFFSIPPVSDFRDCFNIRSVAVPSMSGSYFKGASTAFDCWWGDAASVGGNDDLCRKYTLEAIGGAAIDDAITIVLMNSPEYAGTTYMYSPSSGQYGRGWTVSYIPLCSDTDAFRFLVRHEAVGHGFAKLADEYAYEYNGHIPSDVVKRLKEKEKFGWWKNLDFTGERSDVKWTHFIEDERYASERVNVYEGGYGYWTGVWVPTWRSLMRADYGSFNPPSRMAVWQRIFSLAYGTSWNSSYEYFVDYDCPPQPAVRSDEREYPHPASPVIR